MKNYKQDIIDAFIYDLHTIECLMHCGRIKETLPFIGQIFKNIDLFRVQYSKEKGFEEIFGDNFWTKISKQGITFEQIREKIKLWNADYDAVSRKELEATDYIFFVKKLLVWLQNNVYQLHHRSKSPIVKRLEVISIIILFLVSGFMAYFYPKIFIKDNKGLHAKFYEGLDLKKSLGQGVSQQILFMNHLEISPLLPSQNFSVSWDGYLRIPKEGKYTFYITSSAGYRFYIDNKLYLDRVGNQLTEHSFATLNLIQGLHSIRLEYYHQNQQVLFKLDWAIPDGKIEPISSEFFQW